MDYPNGIGENGRTPLQLVNCNGDVEASKRLGPKKAEPNIACKEGDAPLILSSLKDRPAVAKLLIPEKAVTKDVKALSCASQDFPIDLLFTLILSRRLQLRVTFFFRSKFKSNFFTYFFWCAPFGYLYFFFAYTIRGLNSQPESSALTTRTQISPKKM
jgi:hypothetical protein